MEMLVGGLSAVFWGVVLLSIIVFVHEGGHYVAARLFKVRVTEFYLGLPCRFKLFHKSRSHGTEVGVTPILLGGYNRICGMEPGGDDELLASAFAIVQREGRVSGEAVAEELGVDVERAYELLVTLSDWASIRPFYDPERGEKPTQRDYPECFETLARDANLLTEYDDGHDFDAKGSTVAGEPRELANPEEQLELERSHTYLVCGFLKRLVILIAGALVNVALALILVTGVYYTTEYQTPINTNVVGEVSEGSLAVAAGIEAGDKVIRVAGTSVGDWTELADALGAAREAGQDFSLVIERDGVEHELRIDLPEGEEVEAIGISPQMEPYRLTLAEAAQGAFDYAGIVATYALRLIMPQHTMTVLDSSSSIVGISVMASRAAAAGIVDVIAFVAAISMSLGFMNLLPIPPLDGGKILIELIQLFTRRSLPVKVQTAISYVGIAFFIFVFTIVVRNDVLRFVVG